MSVNEAKAREIVTFALDHLPGMQHDDGMYCVEVQADVMQPRGRSIRYSVMVALGLLRARAAGYEVDPKLDQLVTRLLGSFRDPSLTPGDLGLLLWLGARAGRDQPLDVLRELERRVDSSGGIPALAGMEVAWIVIGTFESASRDGDGAANCLLSCARSQLCARNRAASGLLFNSGAGRRRRFPTFATEIYGTLALSRIGRSGDDHALTVARGVADVLLRLQLADGGWPWIFEACRGAVVEPYGIFTVHQDSMAPMALFELFEATAEDRYRAAAVHGLEWIYGRNKLHRPMFDDSRSILYRSIRRRWPWNRAILYASVALAYAARPPSIQWKTRLEIDRTDRPYHLGWVLEAWCGREHLVA